MSFVKCSDIVNFMQKIAPIEFAEEWDNVGLIIGDKEKEVKNILVCLDVTTNVLNYAIKEKIDTIISHHPLIFNSISKITMDNWKSNLISQLIKNEINLYCAHTNLDCAQIGVNWCLAKVLNLEEIDNLDKYAKVGIIKTPQKLISFAERVKTALKIDNIRIVSKNDYIYSKDIKKVMVFSGSFDDSILNHISPEIDVIVTGDIKYHNAVEMIEMDICAIDAGHFATENIIVPVINQLLSDKFPNLNVISKILETDPYIYC